MALHILLLYLVVKITMCKLILRILENLLAIVPMQKEEELYVSTKSHQLLRYPQKQKKADDIMEEQLRYQAEREQREHEQYERIKKKVMEMSLEDLRDYVIYQMIEDENRDDPNYDDEEFFDW